MFFNQTEKKDHQATGITVPHHSGLLTNKIFLKSSPLLSSVFSTPCPKKLGKCCWFFRDFTQIH